MISLEWVVREAALRCASLVVVHAWHMPHDLGYPYAVGVADPSLFETGANDVISTALAQVDPSGLRHPVETVATMDGAATAILHQANRADLIVVGSRGRGGFAGLLLGSVSHQIAHHATCPVVIVRRGTAA